MELEDDRDPTERNLSDGGDEDEQRRPACTDREPAHSSRREPSHERDDDRPQRDDTVPELDERVAALLRKRSGAAPWPAVAAEP